VVGGRTTEYSGGVWWSVEAPMKLISTDLVRLSPKVSSGMVTGSKQG
jgi:hypothetical protein